MHERIALPAHVEIEIVERVRPLVRHDDIGQVGQEQRRIEAPDEARLARAHDVEVVHQHHELGAVVCEMEGIRHVREADRVGVSPIRFVDDQHRIHAELHHVVVRLHHRQPLAGFAARPVFTVLGQRRGARTQEHRIPYERHDAPRAAAQRLQERQRRRRDLRNRPHLVVAAVDEQRIPQPAAEQHRLHHVDVLDAAAVADELRAARLQIRRLLAVDLPAELDHHVERILHVGERARVEYVAIPRQRIGERHVGGVDQRHAVAVRRRHQQLREKQRVLLDAVDPQAFVGGAQSDRDTDAQAVQDRRRHRRQDGRLDGEGMDAV